MLMSDEETAMSGLAQVREEIATLIALELGFGDLEALSPEDREAIERQTTETIEGCGDEKADCTDAHVKLRGLLAEYRRLQQQHADERNDA
ncbi:hypothetical protein MEX01_51570 [Methylorubrum extorquens]|uniref:hypothetical protein n=1 Tax=Methylorubrum extorquens TaxID=408 RepID=UPI001174B9A7|nr:hypothetical protein [Methylorubrum extorquens]GEL44566.1 hypothetical protein MEX01_51570 [Methylorubrum extorquens]